MPEPKDIVSVRRLIEYVGPRVQVEQTLLSSIHGVKRFFDMSITATTLGVFPDRVDGWREGHICATANIFGYLRNLARLDESADFEVKRAAEMIRYRLADLLSLTDAERAEYGMLTSVELAEKRKGESAGVRS